MVEDDFILDGTKVAEIQVTTNYPIVSAYEFEFLKTEKIVLNRLDKCTIYMIVQRPLTYFDEVSLCDGYIYFKIADGQNVPLACRFDLVSAGICEPSEAVDIEVSFFSKTPGTVQPFRDVGAIKVYKLDGSFVAWWSPQKILYEMIVNNLPVGVDEDGDPYLFLDFKVHYIGRAFSRKVWKRLTGHKKMQRILTMQGPIGASPEAKTPFEISLIMLSVVGLTDVPELNSVGVTIPAGVEPIVHKIDLRDENAVRTFMNDPLVNLGDEAMTREVEAMLVNLFKPEENEVKFVKYPKIKGGMRTKGYSHTGLSIERLPAILYTEYCPKGLMET